LPIDAHGQLGQAGSEPTLAKRKHMSPLYEKYIRLLVEMPEPNILKVTMNRPEKLNAADAMMHRELVSIWKDIDADPEVSAVIFTGAGNAFSAGGDLAMVQQAIDDVATRMTVWKEARDLVYNLINCSKPIVSAIHGPAVGAGLVAGILADISIAARSAKIIDGHTRLGVAAGDHAAIIWPLLCGMAKAKYYLLLCEPLSGEEAERIGLISKVVDDNELEEAALTVARKLSNSAPSAIRWTKYALNNWLRTAGPTFDASLAFEMLGFAGPEIKEGLSSHLEKREPQFSRDSLI
ncbi:MAG: enoyl-CoA hydratase/isomerase family protein, partial [Sinobacteraceae bacterium]|nr:enoyl-CoA hydratase/isomerase family protein [Nevskiaceae bacterium]